MILLENAFSDIFKDDNSCKWMSHLQLFIYTFVATVKQTCFWKKCTLTSFFRNFIWIYFNFILPRNGIKFQKNKTVKDNFFIKNSSDCYVFMFLRNSEESDEEVLLHRTTLNLSRFFPFYYPCKFRCKGKLWPN